MCLRVGERTVAGTLLVEGGGAAIPMLADKFFHGVNKVLPAMALVAALAFAASQNAPASAEEQIFIAKNGNASLNSDFPVIHKNPMACRNSRSGGSTEAAAAIGFRADSSRQPIRRTPFTALCRCHCRKGREAISRLAQIAAGFGHGRAESAL